MGTGSRHGYSGHGKNLTLTEAPEVPGSIPSNAQWPNASNVSMSHESVSYRSQLQVSVLKRQAD